jgi:hypothetical protein
VTLTRRIATIGLGLAVGAVPLLTAPTATATAPATATAAAPATTAQAAAAPAAAAPAAARSRVGLHRWITDDDWRSGLNEGLRIDGGALQIATPMSSRTYGRKHYDVSRWTSAWTDTGFGASQLIASWNAMAPVNTWVEVSVRARRGTKAGSWDVVARWADADRGFRRRSLGSQEDDLTSVNVDTVVGNGRRGLASWQVRISLMRRAGTDRTPTVRSASIMTSRVPDRDTVATSRTSMRRGVDLKVPRYSQMVHQGTYPQWDNGGEAWCSPTSTAMILGFWKAGPKRKFLGWIPDGTPQKPVVHAARYVYDYTYDGAGNWPFNTAYAGARGLDAYVTRLRSLREAERYIKAGIPLVASVAFDSGELTGAPISSTNGHLMVIRGFTKRGDVIVNDPAAGSRKTVRRVYDRAQFENAWIPASSGTVYVMHKPGTPLP